MSPQVQHRSDVQQQYWQLLAGILLLGNVQRYSQIHVHAFGLGNHNHSACVVGAGSAQKMVEVTKTPRQGARTACTVDAPRVQIVDAVHALEQLHTPITFLQINCEGCEQYVLERLIEFPALARTVHTIEVQFHCGAVKKDTYCHIDAGLCKLGFELEYRYECVWERWNAAGRSLLMPPGRSLRLPPSEPEPAFLTPRH